MTTETDDVLAEDLARYGIPIPIVPYDGRPDGDDAPVEPGSYRRARAIAPARPGSESSDAVIRRLRDGAGG